MGLASLSPSWVPYWFWVLPEEYCGFLGDDLWFILVFCYA